MPFNQSAQPTSSEGVVDEREANLKIKCFELANEVYKCDSTGRSIEVIANDIYRWIIIDRNTFQSQIDKHAKDLISKPTTA